MKKKILIVEDDKKISTALAVRLRATGYEITMAYDAVIAFSTAVKHQPDLVVLDISMPGGGGFTVADRLQNHGATAGVPMIFITASKQEGLREKAMDLGAVGFFEKPYRDDELVAAVQHTLGDAVTV